jgi:ferrous iron transport protein A
MVQRIPLTDVESGETATVVEILGGMEMQNRLRALGIRNGVKVTKVSGAFARGPVILRIGGTQTALGFGISYRVIVEVER